MGCQVDIAWLRERSGVAGGLICGCCAVLHFYWFGISKVESASAASAASIDSIFCNLCEELFHLLLKSRGLAHDKSTALAHFARKQV